MSAAGAVVTDPADEAVAFAESLRRAVADHPVPDPWLPGGPPADDSSGAAAGGLDRALRETGWFDLEGVAPSIVAVGAAELGRGLAPLTAVDCKLGGSPLVAGLARHGRRGGRAVELRGGGELFELLAREVEPVSYSDASGFVTVAVREELGVVPPPAARQRLEAWRAATLGYLAGLAGGAFDQCLEHLHGRRAFGSTLDAREAVQSRLADLATALEGTRLLVLNDHSWSALGYAAAAAVEVTAGCHQLTGALGFTLAHPLQRRSRRARAMQAFAEAAAEGSSAPGNGRVPRSGKGAGPAEERGGGGLP